MKLSAHFYVLITTLFLVAAAVMAFYNFKITAVIIVISVGQAWWLFTVYKTLTDDYTTNKTFKDWYEDHPIDE